MNKLFNINKNATANELIINCSVKPKLESKYIDSNTEDAVEDFKDTFYNFINSTTIIYDKIIFLCIGTDRATGDSLGPLIGSNLKSHLTNSTKVQLYGTLERPVHALNLIKTINHIKANEKKPLIIAIDASLGKANRIGHVKLGVGSVKPGEGVSKLLPSVGDFYITGIVNFSNGSMNSVIIQTTKLSTVMKMANIISDGINKVLTELE